MSKTFDKGHNFRIISILAQIFVKFQLWSKVSKISILVKCSKTFDKGRNFFQNNFDLFGNFQRFQFESYLSKISKNIDLGKNYLKIYDLGQIFTKNFDFGTKFSKISKNFDFGQIFE